MIESKSTCWRNKCRIIFDYLVSFAFLAKICDMCHINATCINNRCVCNAGFIGNGFQCDGKQSIIHSVKSTFFQGNTVASKNGPLL